MSDTIHAPRSMNNRLILEKYVKEGLRPTETVTKGLVMPQQKTNLKGLKVLMSAKLSDGTFIPAGAIAYIKEDILHTQPWAAKNWECDIIKGQFIIADLMHVEFVKND